VPPFRQGEEQYIHNARRVTIFPRNVAKAKSKLTRRVKGYVLLTVAQKVKSIREE
jgi:hypothetical protein